MGNFNNLAGQHFGRLTAIKRSDVNLNGHVTWDCQCDCGKHLQVRAGSLTSGKTKSCGCLIKDVRYGERKDLVGQRFGKLVVLRETPERLNNFVVWECLCDCGNHVKVRSGSLLCGNTLSCGCSRKAGRSQGKDKTLVTD